MSKGDKVADSLPQRIREAAKVLREADSRCHGPIEGWTPQVLEGLAEVWEAEDNAAAEREAMVEELRIEILHGAINEVANESPNDSAGNVARKLIDAGWKKVTDE